MQFTNVIRAIQLMEMRWEGHVACMTRKRNEYRLKWTLEIRPSCVDWIQLAQ
jgi:hypothetical protein